MKVLYPSEILLFIILFLAFGTYFNITGILQNEYVRSHSQPDLVSEYRLKRIIS